MVNGLLSLFSQLDAFSIIMIALIVFVGLCVGSFARRYMYGDSKYNSFLIRLTLLIITLLVMVSADSLVILFLAWCLSNMLLVSLMVHKPAWKAAKASGIIALKNYSWSALFMSSAFTILYLSTGQISIHAIVDKNAQSIPVLIALILMLVAAMMQSAVWPFHRWLISSLNSPTPVSAMMHAGLINGGGFILVRFAPLYLHYPALLGLLFAIGLTTALLGTLWKLMQTDVKRMLACSTMGQMGFMFAQCGLGLFPAAVAHIVWHSMFKAYLFLASGGAAQEKRLEAGYSLRPLTVVFALLCGFLGSMTFAFITGKSWLAGDTSLVLLVIAFLASSQLALPMLGFEPLRRLPLALTVVLIAAFGYGLSVQLVASMMKPMMLMQPQPLTLLHSIGIVLLVFSWLLIIFLRKQSKTVVLPSWLLKWYVFALNASQPHPSTVTVHRNHYHYE